MKKLKIGARVTIPTHDFLSDGYVLRVMYVIKLDEKAPNEYAWETDEVLMFPEDVVAVEEQFDVKT